VSGRPTWVHHARREQHWRVLEVIEPENTAPSRAGISRYILLVEGPFAFLKGSEGEQYITATGAGAGGGSRRTPPPTHGAGSRSASDAFRVIRPAARAASCQTCLDTCTPNRP
jgi:hypothetical protein